MTNTNLTEKKEDTPTPEKKEDTPTPEIKRGGTIVDAILGKISGELGYAQQHWPPMNSAHEGFAVIMEEMDELWDHVKNNQKTRDLNKMQNEAIQVAAMAARFAIDVCTELRGRK